MDSTVVLEILAGTNLAVIFGIGKFLAAVCYSVSAATDILVLQWPKKLRLLAFGNKYQTLKYEFGSASTDLQHLKPLYEGNSRTYV